MTKTIKIQNNSIDYILKISKRSRRIRLTIHQDGKFIVSAPYFTDQKIIEDFIIKKSEWILQKINYFKNKNININFIRGNKKDYKKYKDIARKIVEQKIEKFNKIYSFKFKRVSIKNQKTRWGSCSKRENLNFNYKIAMIPDKMADYIVIHELCHLGEFNHSQRFWNLVSKAMPEYLEVRKSLKKNISII